MTKSIPRVAKLILMNFINFECFFTFFIFADVTFHSLPLICISTIRTYPVTNLYAFICLQAALIITALLFFGVEIIAVCNFSLNFWIRNDYLCNIWHKFIKKVIILLGISLFQINNMIRFFRLFIRVFNFVYFIVIIFQIIIFMMFLLYCILLRIYF